MDGLLYLLIAAVISYLGSVQLGPVNLRVIQATVRGHTRQALAIGFGGCLPELLYAAIAVEITETLSDDSFNLPWVHVLALLLFTYLAYKNFTGKQRTAEIPAKATSLRGLAEGVVLALLNPQLITFWLLVIAFLKGQGLMLHSSLYNRGMFVAGCALGAFLLQVSFILIVKRYKNSIVKITGGNFNRIIAALFLIMAILEAYKLTVGLI